MAAKIDIKQASRALEIITPLGTDVLGLRSIHVREQLSGGFTIEAELSSNDPDVKFDSIVGHPVAIRLSLPGGVKRYWHALVARFMSVESTGTLFQYRAILVPWLWALTRSSDCRIFQNKKRSEIVQEVFRDRGANDFELRLSGSYQPEEYCVQYRETDFNFISRLLEQEGIAYYFKHTDSAGKLILGDEKAAYDNAPVSPLLYRPNGEKDERPDGVHAWEIEHEVQATQYALSDYNPLKPKESLLRTAKVDRAYGINDRQLFDYPGEYNKPGEAERISRIRLDEVQAASEIIRARTTCLSLGAGHLFKLKDHPRNEQNREYLVTSVDLRFDAGEFVGSNQTKARASCSFTAIPSSQTYRPPRLTPKPTIQGMQPAVVVGPSGEEIYTDENGRVKVQFFWDRQGKADDKSSCWLRIAQSWAGKKWGALYLPRIGHEVLVSFLEGDPDRPIVTGSAYNAENMPPYPLPADKTKSTLKSSSSKGGAGFNEIRFEDLKDKEEVYIHAQKDLNLKVENNQVENIGKDSELKVGKDYKEKIVGEHTCEFDKSSKVSVKEDYNLTVTKQLNGEVGKKFSLVLKDEASVKVAKNTSVEIDKNLTIAAKEIVIQAGDHITIQVGDSYIAIDKTGVSIGTKGKFNVESTGNSEIEAKAAIKLTSTAAMDLKSTAAMTLKSTAPMSVSSDATAELKSAKTTVKGSGMVEVSGGLVKIN